jgi:hypothetical protein
MARKPTRGNQGVPTKKRPVPVNTALVPKKPIDTWLQLGGIFVGIVFFLVPSKTPLLIVGLLVLCFCLLVHPIWNFWWIEERRARRIAALALLVIGLVRVGEVAWPRPINVFFQVQLMPLVNESTAITADVSGALITAANLTSSTEHDLSLILPMPSIRTAESDDPKRLRIEGGGKKRGDFIHIMAPELRPSEHHSVNIEFLEPQKFKTADAWQREYGYPDYVRVVSPYLGPEHRVGEPR